MRARFALVVPVFLAAAGCSSGSDDAATSAESWCDVVAASNALDEEFDGIDPEDSAALQTVIENVGDLGPRFRSAAPDDIEAQVGIYADTNDRLVEIFAAADYDTDALDNDALVAAIGSADGIATEIDVYTVAECGVSLGPDDT
jgi:hypothetical protein